MTRVFILIALVVSSYGDFPYNPFPLEIERAQAVTCLAGFASGTECVVILQVGSSSPWTVPEDWNSSNNRIELWGAGGGGERVSNNNTLGGTGGEGGDYARIVNYANSTGNTVSFQVGTSGPGATAIGSGINGGNTWFVSSSFAQAKGGGGGSNTNGASTVGSSTANGGGSVRPTAKGASGGGGGAYLNQDGGAATDSGSTDGSAGGAGAPQGCCGSYSGGGAGGGAGTGDGGAGGTGSDGTDIVLPSIGVGGGGGGGAGGTGGGGGTVGGAGGAGGSYGAGGGGGGASSGNGKASGNGGNGGPGLIVITYTPTVFSVSGTLYSDEGQTAITSGKTIKVAIGTTTTSVHSTTTDGSGNWSISVDRILTPSIPVVAWVDGDATKATSFTKTQTNESVTNLDLYQDRFIISHEATSGTSTTISDLSFYDADNDTDIGYRANGGALTVGAGTELHIKEGKTFAPGGDVTINGNAGSGTDGSFHLANNAVYTAGGNTTIAGNFTASSSATFTPGNGTLIFNATTTGKIIDTTFSTLGSTTFNGAGGAWSFAQANATTSTTTITAGTVTAPSGIYTITDNFTQNGSFDANGGTVVFNMSAFKTITGDFTDANAFSNVTFMGSGNLISLDANSSTTGNFVTSGASLQFSFGQVHTVGGDFTLTDSPMFATNSYYLYGDVVLSGSPIVIGANTFNIASTTGDQDISGTMNTIGGFSGLGFVFSGNSTKTFINNASTTNFTINSGATVVAPTNLSISGNYTNNGSFTDNGGTVLFNGTTQSLNGTMTTSATDFSTLILGNSGTKTFNNNASTTNLTINSGVTMSAPSVVSLTGNYSNSGTLTANSGLVVLKGSSAQTLSGTMTGSSAFYQLTIENTSANGTTSQSIVFANSASTTNTLTMLASTSAQFPAGATSTFQNIDLQGADGSPVWLKSSSQGSQYGFHVPGTQTSVTSVNVEDAASCPDTITALNSNDLGNTSCWTFVDNLVISGTLYSDEGQSTINTGKTVTIVVGTSTPSFHTTTSDGSGNWSYTLDGFNEVGPSTPILVFLDNETENANLFTKAEAAATYMTGLPLYQDRVIVSHVASAGTSTTIEDMAFYDNTDDSDIQYTASSTRGIITVLAGNELHIDEGKTFAPGGSVIINGNAGSGVDGSFHLTNNAVYTTAADTKISGSLLASSTATHYASSTVFNATTTGKTIDTSSVSSFGDLSFDGIGGAWSFSGANATATSFSIATGTVTAPSNTFRLEGGGFINNGDFTYNSGNIVATSSATGTSGDYSGFSFDTDGSGNGFAYGVTYWDEHFWAVDRSDGEVYKYTASGTYTGTSWDTAASGNAEPWGITYANGFFWVTDDTDKVIYQYDTDGTYTGTIWDTGGSGVDNPRGITYANGYFWVVDDHTQREVYKHNPDGTYTGFSFDTAGSGNALPYDITYANGYLWVTDPTDNGVYKYNLDGTYTGTFLDTSMTGTDTYGITYANGYLWILDGGNGNDEVYKFFATQEFSGNLASSSALGNIELRGRGTKTFASTASTTDLNITEGTLVATNTLSISGDYTNSGTATFGVGSVTLNGTTPQTLTGNMVGNDAFYNLVITNTSQNGTTSQSIIFASAASTTNTLTMLASTSAQFLAGATSTFQNIDLQGADGSPVWLKSSSQGSQYGFHVPGTQVSVTYVNVEDAVSCPDTITADANSLDLGNTACWTFLTSLILSGSLFSDEGLTPITSGKTIGIAVGTTTASVHSTSSDGSGNWTFDLGATHSVGASTPILMWVDGDGTTRATLVTKAENASSISNLDLYQNRVVVSHEATSGTSTTIEDMAFYDNTDDGDIQYTASSTRNILTVHTGNELHIDEGKTFAPGGSVIINGNAGSGLDGSFHMPNNATFTGGGVSVSGNFSASSSAIYNASSTLFTATTTGKTINATVSTFGDMIFDGVGGAWSFTQANATATSFTIATGTVTAPSNILKLEKGQFENSGTFTHNSGTIVATSSVTVEDGTNVSFDTAVSGNDNPYGITYANGFFWIVDADDDEVYKYELDGTYTGFSFDTTGSGNDYARGITYANGYLWVTDTTGTQVYKHNLDGTYTGTSWDTAGSGNSYPYGITYGNGFFWIVNGGFGGGDEVYKYNLDGTYTGTSFDTLVSGGTEPYGITYANGHLWVTDDDSDEVYKYNLDGTYTGTSFDTAISPSNGNPYGIINVNGDFWITDAVDREVYKYTAAQGFGGTLTGGSALNNLELQGVGTKEFASDASTTDLTISEGTLIASSTELSVSGDYTNNGTTTYTNSTTTFNGTTQSLSGTMTDTSAFSNVVFANSGTKTFNNNASTSDLTINSGVTVVATTSLSISGDYSNNGTTTYSPAGGGGATKDTFTADDTFTVPAGVTSITIKAWGAGGHTNGPYGGGGGYAQGTVSVSPDDVLAVRVGAAGGALSSAGLTGVFDNNTVTIGNAMIVAGSGGNAGLISFGAAAGGAGGGSTGGSGDDVQDGTGGTGGTQVAGGSGDRGGSNGSALTGGAPGTGSMYGGAGYYGGGGGGGTGCGSFCTYVAGGGGGSNYISGSNTQNLQANASVTPNTSDEDYVAGKGNASEPGYIVISYTAPGAAGAGTTTFNGTTQSLSGTMTGSSAFDNVVFANSGTKTFNNNASTSDLTINSGVTVVATTSLSISGDYTNNGTFEAGTGTTTFNGTAAQTATGTMTDTSAFYNLEVTNTSASTTFGAPLTVDGYFTAIQPNTILEFVGGGTTTMATATITGTSGNEIKLYSSTDGTQYNLKITGAYTIEYADISDSAACGSTGGGLTATSSVDSTGNTCWTFAEGGGGILISGTLYSDEGLTAISGAKNIAIAVGTTTTSVHATTSLASGVWNYTFDSSESIGASTPILIFIDNETENAVLFTKASTSGNDITGLDLYQNRVIISHEGTSGTSTTLSDMTFYDNTDDSDIQYTASTTAGGLTVLAGNELHVAENKTFAPNATVVINGNGGSGVDGSLHLPNNATYINSDTSIAGNFSASSTATLTSTGTISFTATTTGKTIDITTSLGNVTFNGVGGAWSFSQSNATATSFTIATGTVTAPSNILKLERGGFANSGTFTHNSGTIIATSSATGTSGNYTGTSWDTAGSGNLYPGGIAYGSGHFWIQNTVNNDIYKYNPDGTYTGTSWDVCTASGSLNCDPYGLAYWDDHLWVTDTGDDEVYKYTTDGTYTGTSWSTLATGNRDAFGITYWNNHFWVTDRIDEKVYKYTTDGTYTGTSWDTTGNTNPIGITFANGYFWIAYNVGAEVYKYTTDGTYTGISWITASSTGAPAGITYWDDHLWVTDGVPDEVYKHSVAQAFGGTLTEGSPLNNVELQGIGTKEFASDASTTDLTISEGTLIASSTELSVSGDYTNNGTTTYTNSTTTFNGTTQSLSGTMTDTSAFSNVVFANSGTKTFNNNASTSDLTINSGVTVVAPTSLSISGDYTQNGSFTDSTGTVYFNGSTEQTVSGTLNTTATDFNNVVFNGATTTFANNASTSDFTINANATVTAPAQLSVRNNFTQNGKFIAGSGEVVLNGTSQQTMSGTMTGNSAFYDLEIQNTSANGTTSRSIVFANVASTTNTLTMLASTSAQFPAGATSTFQNIDLQGSAGSPVWIVSSATGTQAGFYVPGTQTSVTYVNVRDIGSCPTTITADANSLDLGGVNCWSFGGGGGGSGILISGTLYSDEGLTAISGAKNIAIAVGTTTTSVHATTSLASGAWNYTFDSSESIGASTPILIFIDNETENAALFTKASTSGNNISNLDLYKDRVIISHEGTSGTSTNNAELGFYDGLNDSDIQYQVGFGDALEVSAGNELRIKEYKTYAPGGAVIINANASATTTDGAFYVASSSTYTAGGNLTLGGNLFVDERGTFTHGGYTTTFNGSTTRDIDVRESANTPNLGALTFANTATTTMLHSATTTDVTINSGAIMTAPGTLTLTGDFTNNGTYNAGEGGAKGEAWTARSAVGNNDPWERITYGGSLFVAVGGQCCYDSVMTSPDGINWTARSGIGGGHIWQDVVYGGGRFVAVSQSTYGGEPVMYSDDGINWSTTTVTGDDDWFGVAYGNGLFVAVGHGDGGDYVMYSPDGINWSTTTAAGDDDSWNEITYGNGLFVAVGGGVSDRIMTSPDGINWTVRTPPSSNAWLSVTYGNGLFVGVSSNGTDKVITSPDGINWTLRSTAGDDAAWQSVTYGNGLFVAVACGYGAASCNGTAGDRVMISSDGITWTTQTDTEDVSWQGVAYGNGLFVAVANQTGTNLVMTAPAGSLLKFASTSAQTATGTMTDESELANVEFDGSGTKTFVTNASTTDVTINSGATVVAPTSLSVSGDFTQNGSFTDNFGTVYFNGTSTISGTLNTTATDFNNVVFNGTSATFSNNASTSDFTIESGVSVTAPTLLTVGGDFTQDGTFNANSGTLHFGTSTETISGSLVGSNALNNITVNGEVASSTSLLSHWKFDGGIGTSAIDSGSNSNTGTFNSTAAWADGRLGSGITLDGDSDYITVTQNNEYDISTGDFTISAWVWDDTPKASLGTYHRIVSWYDGTNNIQLGLGASSGAGRAFYIFNNSVGASANEATAPIADSDTGWKHVVATKNGSTYTVYVDGAASSGTLNVTVGVFTGNSTTLYIGQRGDASSTYVDGEIDDVRIYNTALSAAEVNELYNERYAQFTSNASTTNATINSGTLSASTSVSNITISGDYTNNSGFDAGLATTTLSGTSAQTATGTMTGADTFYNLEVLNNSATTTFGSALTVENHFKAVQTNSIIELASGATSTIETATITGTSGNEVKLRATIPGTQAGLSVTDSYGIEYADVQDSAACGSVGGGITSDSTSIDSGNNTCWTFPVAGGPKVWNSTDWTLYDTLTIDSDNIDDDLTDFPVYVDLSDLSATFWSTTPSGSTTVGTDIRITTNDGSPTELPRELVFASSTAQTGELHFKADSISSTTDTVFRIYYNGTTTGDYAVDATYGAENVWTNEYVAVWHMQENPSTESIIDSTSNTIVGTSGGSMTSSDLVSGRVGSAINFDGADDIIDTGSSYPTLTAYTVSAWVKPTSYGENSFGRIYDGQGLLGYLNNVSENYPTYRMLQDHAAQDGAWDMPTGAVDIGAYQHVVIGNSDVGNTSNTPVAFLNGNSQTLTLTGSGPSGSFLQTGNLYIGNNSLQTRTFDGDIDEMRISSTSRSSAWVSAEYLNQSTTTDFYTINDSPILSSGENQTFYFGDATTTIATISITDSAPAAITATNDIRIKIATSSVGMLWATDDTTATFGGTASGKVSNPVTFEGNGSVLVIPVDSDFSGGETLTIADLSFAQFTGTTSSPVNALSLYTGGGSDTDADATDTYTIAIEPTIYLDAHSGGAIPNNFDDGNNVAIEILGFSLDPRGENINVDTLVVSLSSVSGVNTVDITNATLYRDMDSSRTYTAGDVQVGGSGSVFINGKTGSITFSTTFVSTTTQDYILIADVAGTGQSDRMTVYVTAGSITATAESGGAITETGNMVRESHSRERSGGGSSGGEIGGGGAESGGEVGGGGEGDGGGEIDPDTGDGLSNRPEFNPASSNGTPNSGWTNGGNAYASDGNYATAGSDALQHSFGNFGFTLSGSATILGVEVEIELSASTNAGDVDVALSWDGGSSWTTAKTTATASTTDAVYTLGGSADTWGHAWTPAQTVDGTFILDVTANTSSNTLQIDAFQVRIYNEVGGGGAGGGGGEI